MILRTHLGAAALSALVLSACGVNAPPQSDAEGAGDGGPAGCVGVCSHDGGTGSLAPDGGTAGGGGGHEPLEMTIAALRQTAVPGQRVTLRNLVVHAVDRSSDFFDPDGGTRVTLVTFWVGDLSNPGQGLYIEKLPDDFPRDYRPLIGDVLTVTGYVQQKGETWDRSGYRTLLGSQLSLDGGSGKLTLELAGTAPAPEPAGVPAGFGNADGGVGRPNPEYAGALVRIPGPVTLTNREPTALRNLAEDGGYLGFEVEGGVLISDVYTSRLCDWRNADAGVGGRVVFPEGIAGVWDTYTHAECTDATCAERYPGRIPGTYDPATRDGGNAYTYVLYPRDCGDVQGQLVPGALP